MSPRRCILGCPQGTGPLYEVRSKRRALWLKQLGIKNLPNRYCYVCYRHFSSLMISGRTITYNGYPDQNLTSYDASVPYDNIPKGLNCEFTSDEDDDVEIGNGVGGAQKISAFKSKKEENLQCIMNCRDANEFLRLPSLETDMEQRQKWLYLLVKDPSYHTSNDLFLCIRHFDEEMLSADKDPRDIYPNKCLPRPVQAPIPKVLEAHTQCIQNCTYYKRKYSFPQRESDAMRRRIWLERFGRSTDFHKEGLYACDGHFSKSMYIGQYLRAVAVPNKNLGITESLLKVNFYQEKRKRLLTEKGMVRKSEEQPTAPPSPPPSEMSNGLDDEDLPYNNFSLSPPTRQQTKNCNKKTNILDRLNITTVPPTTRDRSDSSPAACEIKMRTLGVFLPIRTGYMQTMVEKADPLAVTATDCIEETEEYEDDDNDNEEEEEQDEEMNAESNEEQQEKEDQEEEQEENKKQNADVYDKIDEEADNSFEVVDDKELEHENEKENEEQDAESLYEISDDQAEDYYESEIRTPLTYDDGMRYEKNDNTRNAVKRKANYDVSNADKTKRLKKVQTPVECDGQENEAEEEEVERQVIEEEMQTIENEEEKIKTNTNNVCTATISAKTTATPAVSFLKSTPIVALPTRGNINSSQNVKTPRICYNNNKTPRKSRHDDGKSAGITDLINFAKQGAAWQEVVNKIQQPKHSTTMPCIDRLNEAVLKVTSWQQVRDLARKQQTNAGMKMANANVVNNKDEAKLKVECNQQKPASTTTITKLTAQTVNKTMYSALKSGKNSIKVNGKVIVVVNKNLSAEPKGTEQQSQPPLIWAQTKETVKLKQKSNNENDKCAEGKVSKSVVNFDLAGTSTLLSKNTNARAFEILAGNEKVITRKDTTTTTKTAATTTTPKTAATRTMNMKPTVASTNGATTTSPKPNQSTTIITNQLKLPTKSPLHFTCILECRKFQKLFSLPHPLMESGRRRHFWLLQLGLNVAANWHAQVFICERHFAANMFTKEGKLTEYAYPSRKQTESKALKASTQNTPHHDTTRTISTQISISNSHAALSASCAKLQEMAQSADDEITRLKLLIQLKQEATRLIADLTGDRNDDADAGHEVIDIT